MADEYYLIRVYCIFLDIVIHTFRQYVYPKLGYFDGLGVFCHMYINMINQKIMSLIFKSENPL